MASNPPDDILVSLTASAADGRLRPSCFAAYVPIIIAVIGVAVILLGGVSARNFETATPALDPMMTGSVQVPPGGETDLR